MKREIPFIGIGEKIHCTRIFSAPGPKVDVRADGAAAIRYRFEKEDRELPVPTVLKGTAAWQNSRVKHCAVAVWQGLYGAAADQRAGVDYLEALAMEQQAHGAGYLDVNVDEFGGELAEKVRAMTWLAGVVQEASELPLCIDSSSPEILRAGLAACHSFQGRPMLNSVSLERIAAISMAAEFNAMVIASAAGEKELPATNADRLRNLEALMARLQQAEITPDRIFIDPLVFPVATNGAHGRLFLEAVAAIRRHFGFDVHVTGGFSNVSYGLPKRDLINAVFAWLAIQAGADSGIVDPAQINPHSLGLLDPDSESFRLAKNLLTGEDEFGQDFIAAARAGIL